MGGGIRADFPARWRRAQDVTWAAAPIAPPRKRLITSLERAARGLAEELQGFERAEVVARDAAPQARRAVVAVRPRPLRLRNDEALARGARASTAGPAACRRARRGRRRASP